MRFLAYFTTVVLAAIMSGCGLVHSFQSQYQTNYKYADGDKVWQWVDTKSLKLPENFENLVVINARKGCANIPGQFGPNGESSCPDISNGRWLPYGTGFVGAMIGGTATAIAFDPEKNMLIGFNHSAYGSYHNNTLLETGEIFRSAMVGELTNSTLNSILTIMYKAPNLVAAYMNNPTCPVQREMTEKADAVKTLGPSLGLREGLNMLMATGYDPSTKKTSVPDDAAVEKSKYYYSHPDALWKDIDAKGYCTLAKTYIDNAISVLVFGALIPGSQNSDAVSRMVKVNKQWDAESLLGRFSWIGGDPRRPGEMQKGLAVIPFGGNEPFGGTKQRDNFMVVRTLGVLNKDLGQPQKSTGQN